MYSVLCPDSEMKRLLHHFLCQTWNLRYLLVSVGFLTYHQVVLICNSSSTFTGQVIFILSSLKSDKPGTVGIWRHIQTTVTMAWLSDLVSTPWLCFCFKCSCQSKILLRSLLVAVQTLYCSDLLPELCHFLFVCVKGAPQKMKPKRMKSWADWKVCRCNYIDQCFVLIC